MFWQEHHRPLPCEEKSYLTFKVAFQRALQSFHQTGGWGGGTKKGKANQVHFCPVFKGKSTPHTRCWFRWNASMEIQWIVTFFAELEKKCVPFEWVVLQRPDPFQKLWGERVPGKGQPMQCPHRGTKPPRDRSFSSLPSTPKSGLGLGQGSKEEWFLSSKCTNMEWKKHCQRPQV